MFGDIVKVTPSSKVVGDMALMMVAQGLTPADVLDPAREIAFPDSVVEMLHGDLGQPPGGWPPALQEKVLKGATPITVAAGLAAAPSRSRRRARAEAEKRCGRSARRRRARLVPDVSEGVRRLRRHASASTARCRRCRRRSFSTAWTIGEEITVEIERGKTLVVRCRRSARPTRTVRSASSSS